MKNFYKRYIVIIGVTLCIIMLSACGNNTPKEADIMSALQSQDLDDYSVNNVKINKSQILDHQAEYWCTAELENEMYLKTVDVILEFEYYDTGGWIFDDITDMDVISYKPISGYSESEAINELSDEYSGLEVVEHNTDLDIGVDEFVLSYSNEGIAYDESGIIYLTYYINDYNKWQLDKENITITIEDCSLHIDGMWEVIRRSNDGSLREHILTFDDNSDGTLNLIDNWYIDEFGREDFYITKIYTIKKDDILNNNSFISASLNGVFCDDKEMTHIDEIPDDLSGYINSAIIYDESYMGVKDDVVELPDFHGIPYNNAIDAIEDLGLCVVKGDEYGSNYYLCDIQLLDYTSIEPDIQLKKNSEVRLVFTS